VFFYFLHASAATAVSTSSLHDALPIFLDMALAMVPDAEGLMVHSRGQAGRQRALCRLLSTQNPTQGKETGRLLQRNLYGRQLSGDRKSTRLNSSHVKISYAVFCLKKKK